MTTSNTIHRNNSRDMALDLRRPGIVKGAILPVTRRPVDNMVVAATST